MMTYATIELVLEQDVATIALGRPDALNALSPAMLAELDDAIGTLPDTLRVLVITGRGRAFCAGADLAAVGRSIDADDGLLALLGRIQAVFARLRNLPFPVVAGVNGLALAGGLELALCADIVVAAQSARFGDCHSNYGVVAGAGSCAILPRIVGPVIAKYLQFTGATLSAHEMAQAGLVARVWPDELFPSELAALAGLIAEKGPLANRHMKRLTAAAATETVEAVLALELEANMANARSHDMREGMEAFARKRKPVFIGG